MCIRDRRNVSFLNDGKEILFRSERNGWGHYYLYDTCLLYTSYYKNEALYQETLGLSHGAEYSVPLPQYEEGASLTSIWASL